MTARALYIPLAINTFRIRSVRSSDNGQFSETSPTHRQFHPDSINVAIIDLPVNVFRYGKTTDMYFVKPSESSPFTVPLSVKVLRTLPEGRESTRSNIVSLVNVAYLHLSSDIMKGHDNVCSFHVVYVSTNSIPSYALATPWFDNGNILEYVNGNPGINKFPFLMQVASGLEYLHARGVVHGNLCPNNILISDDFRAHITDVGLDLLSRQASLSAVDQLAVSTHWMFKSRDELFPSETAVNVQHTTAMDVYSFACNIFTIYSGRLPFSSHHHASSRGLCEIMYHGHSRLHKPATISEDMWSLVIWCWKDDPAERPTMKEVVAKLRELVHL